MRLQAFALLYARTPPRPTGRGVLVTAALAPPSEGLSSPRPAGTGRDLTLTRVPAGSNTGGCAGGSHFLKLQLDVFSWEEA